MTIKLTPTERTVLRNQLEILKLLEGKKPTRNYDEEIEILKHGYVSKYSDIVDVYDEVPEEDTTFVYDVLQMFRVLHYYMQDNPSDTDTPKNSSAKFQGFDGNNEGRLHGFARFLISEHIFAEQYARKKELDGFNSHMPTVDWYGRMVEKWKSFDKPVKLTRAQVDAILEAAKHPGV